MSEPTSTTPNNDAVEIEQHQIHGMDQLIVNLQHLQTLGPGIASSLFESVATDIVPYSHPGSDTWAKTWLTALSRPQRTSVILFEADYELEDTEQSHNIVSKRRAMVRWCQAPDVVGKFVHALMKIDFPTEAERLLQSGVLSISESPPPQEEIGMICPIRRAPVTQYSTIQPCCHAFELSCLLDWTKHRHNDNDTDDYEDIIPPHYPYCRRPIRTITCHSLPEVNEERHPTHVIGINYLHPVSQQNLETFCRDHA